IGRRRIEPDRLIIVLQSPIVFAFQAISDAPVVARRRPQTDPGGRVSPRFRHRLILFRHFNSGLLALASLNLTRWDWSQRWLQRSPPSLLTTAACSGLRPAPGGRPRRATLHLSYSCAPPFGPAMLVCGRDG